MYFMSQLILLAQRIRAIETIKKITHAMQLISMSTHSRLRHKRTQIDRYNKEIIGFWDTLSSMQEHSFFVPEKTASEHILFIVIGGQKGLAGSYTNALLNFFEREYAKIDPKIRVSIIAIGKQLLQQFTHRDIPLFKSFDNLTVKQLPLLAHELLREITHEPRYTQVIVASSYQKTFFIQKQHITNLIPLTQEDPRAKKALPTHYIWEQDQHEVVYALAELKLYAKIQDILVESLSAEAAARFISMQNATQNADSLLTDMKLEFNKRRQAKITLELSELATSYGNGRL